MYVAITRAWYRMHGNDQRRQYPLRPYVLGPLFARTVTAAFVDPPLVARVCAQLASLHRWQVNAGESLPLRHEPREVLDPARAWWLELEGRAGLGLHYVELGGGLLEFLSIAPQRDRPPIERVEEAKQ